MGHLRDSWPTNAAVAIAVVRGSEDSAVSRGDEMVSNDLDLLTGSQLLYSPRESASRLQLANIERPAERQRLVINKLGVGTIGGKVERARPLVVGRQWRTFAGRGHFFRLLRMVSRKDLPRGWRKDVTHAGEIAGRSVRATDRPSAFFWNMVGLELLLVSRAEKHREALMSRLHALFGWVPLWQAENYDAQIVEMINARNDLVHAGAYEDVSEGMLRLSDELFANTLYYVVSMTTAVRSKADLITLAAKRQAAQTLGLSRPYLPRSRVYTRKR